MNQTTVTRVKVGSTKVPSAKSKSISPLLLLRLSKKRSIYELSKKDGEGGMQVSGIGGKERDFKISRFKTWYELIKSQSKFKQTSIITFTTQKRKKEKLKQHININKTNIENHILSEF